MTVNIGQPQRHRVCDELSEHAPPPGQRPDLTSCRLVDAQREESRQLAAGLIEHPKRRILRVGQVAARLEHPLEHEIDVQLAQDGPSEAQHRPRSLIHRQRPRGPRRVVFIASRRLAA